jgi:hypothetical protein
MFRCRGRHSGLCAGGRQRSKLWFRADRRHVAGAPIQLSLSETRILAHAVHWCTTIAPNNGVSIEILEAVQRELTVLEHDLFEAFQRVPRPSEGEPFRRLTDAREIELSVQCLSWFIGEGAYNSRFEAEVFSDSSMEQCVALRDRLRGSLYRFGNTKNGDG